MNEASRWIAFIAAVLALLVVVLGALGSHAIDIGGLDGAWNAAIRMHLFNAAGLLGLAALNVHHRSVLLVWGAWVIVSGTLLFAGSIYLHVMTGYQIINMAPVGGTLMMLGWLLAVLALVWKR
ncbi:MAG: DUF423 domain-containing protein [Xanthomonadales bacterium]|nr:DUF423 domain-containing protein [Xanthomonadales bacterium]